MPGQRQENGLCKVSGNGNDKKIKDKKIRQKAEDRKIKGQKIKSDQLWLAPLIIPLR